MGEASDKMGQSDEENDSDTGTPGYKAHEIGGGVYTKTIEIFALGAVMFYFLENKMPWGNEADYADCKVTNPDAKVTEWLLPLMQRCLSKNPEMRPQIKEIASEIACHLFTRSKSDKTS